MFTTKTRRLAAAFVLAAAAATGLAGCGKAPISTEPTQNSEISYSVLFNRHGCEIGRFEDYGRPVYVTICPDGTSASQSSHSESCGKNCTQTVDTYQMQQRGGVPPPSYAVPAR